MQQKIHTYCIIGSGRVAKHISYYFSLLSIRYKQWSRAKNIADLDLLLEESDVIMVLINDDETENFIDKYISKDKLVIHLSGSLYIKRAIGIHPLMSFSDDLYHIDEYKKINFVIDRIFDFKSIFPNLENKFYYINEKQKSYYHALCVLSGNFSSILWNKLFSELEQNLNIPKEAAFPYLDSITNNLKTNYKRSLTGPLVRNDKATIKNNIESLSDDNYKIIYEAFLDLFNKENNFANK